ncbi:MAG: NRDE family protein, partial [bacterium]|nr:NRDE family protein [bacterium]
MCLILFAHRCDPRYPLVVAASRDEFYDRPTRPAGFWKDDGLAKSPSTRPARGAQINDSPRLGEAPGS